jgi:hypothetical protein
MQNEGEAPFSPFRILHELRDVSSAFGLRQQGIAYPFLCSFCARRAQNCTGKTWYTTAPELVEGLPKARTAFNTQLRKSCYYR